MAIAESDRFEIAFFDVETTVPTRTGMGHAILEFGSILVCPKKLIELRSYSTLVRPADLSHITSLSVRCNGITKDAVVTAPTFADIADAVYDLLHGRIWAGHNILRFDCARIREAFAEIRKPAPEPKGTIDSLALLTQRFGRRAGDMKMASLATYFGLGQQTHRSLDDVRMNLEVLKYCATVLFLESSLPDIFTENSWVSPNATTRSRNSGKKSTPSSSLDEKNHPILSLMTPNTGEVDLPQPLDMTSLSAEIGKENPRPDNMEEEKADSTSQLSSVAGGSVNTNNDFLEPDAISLPSLSAICVPFYRGTQKIQITYQNVPLQLQCACLKVRFGISTKFVDHAGRPRLNFVVDASPSLCKVLDAGDSVAQKLSVDYGSSSEWRPVVARKPGFFNSPTVRLHIPTIADGEVTTEIYHKDSLAAQRLVFSSSDVSELDSLICPGNVVDVCFSLDTYDYQMSAGIRLVARKLMVHST